MKNTNPPLKDVYQTLYKHWGPQNWWPGRTRLEIVVGAILTQNTAWTQVEKAIRRLKQEGGLNLATLTTISEKTLADWIRPSGTFSVKAKRIKAFVNMLNASFDGRLQRLFALDTDALRSVLLETHGIGPETADSIVLYAAGRPSFVVDAYTRRFLSRHAWISPNASYDAIARLFTDNLPLEAHVYNEYHALIVRLGKEYCRPRPRCADCPLRKWLPGIEKMTPCT